MEVGGHDHFTSMRYHTQKDILDTDYDVELDDSLFHNILVNPSLTPWYYNNPGVSALEINDKTLVPHNYQASYLNLAPTMGKKAPMTPYDELEWRDLDYQTEFGLEDLTVTGIHKLRLRLQEDQHLQHDFMIRKIGLDPSDPKERNQAFQIFLDGGMIDE